MRSRAHFSGEAESRLTCHTSSNTAIGVSRAEPETRSHLLGTEQDRPGACFGLEMLHQLPATLALLLLVLVPQSLDCLLSTKSFEGSLCSACLQVITEPFHHFLGF
jgi:hypothetical protein